MNEYSPLTCSTAEELRESGFPIPEEIPNYAWIPRDSLISNVTIAKNAQDIAVGLVKANVEFKFTEPFQWVESTAAFIND